MTNPADTPSITIRPVRTDELDTFFDLTLLVDLHLAADELPALKVTFRAALHLPSGPFSHGLHHFLVAESTDKVLVAAIHVGPAHWMLSPQLPAFVQHTLVKRIGNIDTIAVHPDHRHQGIAARLLARVESDFRRAGYRALALRHEHDKKTFFTAHGFTTLPRLVVDLQPFGGLFKQQAPGWKHAVKPLDPSITFTSQRGLTAVSGLLG
ncbi:GNAT family N-acetyltransferase [Streptomyces sp. NPDC059783]|uniref:GNAT family N-acetyltransferase n=1 Tax=Streptomyces sp. NPDC059783 TaxID=3346944 RepID=UPI0036493CC8